MSTRAVVLFLHVVSMLGLFVALTLEGVTLARTGRATRVAEAAEWSRLWSALMPVGLPSTLVALASGIFLATTEGAWDLVWVKLAVPTLVAVAALGGAIGPRRARVQKALAADASKVSLAAFRQPAFAASWRARASLLTGLVFVMTARPDGSAPLWALAGFAVVGVLWGAAAWTRQRDKA